MVGSRRRRRGGQCKETIAPSPASHSDPSAEVHIPSTSIGGSAENVNTKQGSKFHRITCSQGLRYEKWRYVPEEVRAPLRHKLLGKTQKNVDYRGKRKWESRNGSKSTIHQHIERGATMDSPTGHIETWRSRHWKAECGWFSPELEAKYVSRFDF
ncbi:hypothetical protein DITRI_Ditri14bG0090500 [Diplodiscus trichospermus]